MVAGCGNNCIKYILFFINFLFFIMGAVGIGLGIYALVDKKNMSDLASLDSSGKVQEFNGVGLLQSGAIALIVGGAFLFITGFAGCCGAVKEIKCLLGVYIAIVLLVVVAEVVAAALAIAFRTKIEDKLTEGLVNGLRYQYDGLTNSSDPFSRAFDFAQVEFQCCGVNGARDYLNSKWYNTTANRDGEFPKTCCKLKNKDNVLNDNAAPEPLNPACTRSPISDANEYSNTPCYQAIRDWVMKHAAIIIGIAIGIAAIEIMAIIFACCLYRAIED